MSLRSGDQPNEDSAEQATVTVSKAPSPFLRIGLIAALVVLGVWMMTGLVSRGSEAPERLAAPTTTGPQPESTTTPLAATSVDGNAQEMSEALRPEVVAAREILRKSPGIGLTLCNAQTKYFNETPEQIERARRYAQCLDDFGIPFRLPTATFHQAYAIPQDLEPSVVLRCGELLTGPDVSTAAYEQFERCARDAEELFGINRVTS